MIDFHVISTRQGLFKTSKRGNRLHCSLIFILLEVLFTNPSARAGYDTRSIFKRSLTGFEFRVFLLLD